MAVLNHFLNAHPLLLRLPAETAGDKAVTTVREREGVGLQGRGRVRNNQRDTKRGQQSRGKNSGEEGRKLKHKLRGQKGLEDKAREERTQ